jgi:hypothetical protein
MRDAVPKARATDIVNMIAQISPATTFHCSVLHYTDTVARQTYLPLKVSQERIQ